MLENRMSAPPSRFYPSGLFADTQTHGQLRYKLTVATTLISPVLLTLQVVDTM